MTINSNTVEQINVALLAIDQQLKNMNLDSEALTALETTVNNIKASLNETKAGLQSGATYNINITGNAATATVANSAGSANTASYATSSGSADTANSASVADTVDSTWLLNAVYPVNTVYMSVVNTNPATVLGGGSWTSITAPTGMYAWKRTT